MGYFIAIIVFLGGLPFIFTARRTADNVKDIEALLSDDKNRQEAEGSLQVIVIRGGRHSFECDGELVFIDHNGKILIYKETFFASDSKASFLRECENNGKVPVTVIYDKHLPSRHFVKELKPLEVNKNSRVGYTIIGIVFMFLGILIFSVEFFRMQW